VRVEKEPEPYGSLMDQRLGHSSWSLCTTSPAGSQAAVVLSGYSGSEPDTERHGNLVGMAEPEGRVPW